MAAGGVKPGGPGRKTKAVAAMLLDGDEDEYDMDDEHPHEIISNLKHLTHPRSDEEKKHVVNNLPRAYKKQVEEQGQDIHEIIEDHPVTFVANNEADVGCAYVYVLYQMIHLQYIV